MRMQLTRENRPRLTVCHFPVCRFHCKKCEDFDLCGMCFESESRKRQKKHKHAASNFVCIEE